MKKPSLIVLAVVAILGAAAFASARLWAASPAASSPQAAGAAVRRASALRTRQVGDAEGRPVRAPVRPRLVHQWADREPRQPGGHRLRRRSERQLRRRRGPPPTDLHPAGEPRTSPSSRERASPTRPDSPRRRSRRHSSPSSSPARSRSSSSRASAPASGCRCTSTRSARCGSNSAPSALRSPWAACRPGRGPVAPSARAAGLAAAFARA